MEMALKLKTSDFVFDLPKKLIAQDPPAERGESRLLVIDRETRSLDHRMVRELPLILPRGTVMVFNNSRVRKARLFALSEASGARHEFLLLEKALEDSWRVMLSRARRCRLGSRYLFADGLSAEITGIEGEHRLVRFSRPVDDAWLEVHGHVPLPPYIRRKDGAGDEERYQTVYARDYGSAAAPTAGLHFTEELLGELGRAGIESIFITLHVGPGTFLPVRSEKLEDHKMHEETYFIDDESADRIEKAKAEGRKILAVGTTSLRTLESAWEGASGADGRIKRGAGRTSIFIYPGYTFKLVDALFTNFHTPGSTLLMLVSAFAGRDFILETYREAVDKGYRFFSYGDACLIL
jgi:S-adenosylmethionine:tRNA ribosyltransferase-isomerase